MPATPKKQLGDRGEVFVARWLQKQGWVIVAQQWHCRWGELDIVARHPQAGLAFVEVKTRQRSSLDWGGRLSITLQKQQKLWRSAQIFLADHPQLGEIPCRFDVALVMQGPIVGAVASQRYMGQPPLALVEYIENAFQVS